MTNNFSWRVRVYYEDTDAGGVVFYANYLKFFERARSEWLRAAGVQQQELMQTDAVMFVVTGAAVDYHAPAQLDDELMVTVTVEKLGRASVQFMQQAWRGEKLLTSGKIKAACVDVKSFRPRPIPRSVLLKIAPQAEHT